MGRLPLSTIATLQIYMESLPLLQANSNLFTPVIKRVLPLVSGLGDESNKDKIAFGVGFITHRNRHLSSAHDQ
jgi:hypothetical protein